MPSTQEILAREILDVVPSVMRKIRTEMRSQRYADLAIPQFRALTYINRNPGVSLQAVAHHLGLTSPTVCKMVDGLVLDGLVQRAPHARDRRKITLTLTSQGQVVLEQTRHATQDRLAEVLGHLTPLESETVMQAMQLLHPLFSPGAGHLKGKSL
jgi:DNA-binding MarR family transcriptional regulator